MLACPYPRFTEIRIEANIALSKIATALMEERGPHQKHFMQQLYGQLGEGQPTAGGHVDGNLEVRDATRTNCSAN